MSDENSSGNCCIKCNTTFENPMWVPIIIQIKLEPIGTYHKSVSTWKLLKIHTLNNTFFLTNKSTVANNKSKSYFLNLYWSKIPVLKYLFVPF